jgi:hypothetical protein
MHSIEHNGVTLTEDGARINGGSLVLWEDLYRILEALPEVANRCLGWFKITGPPSQCVMAKSEAEKIVKALFPESELESPKPVVWE